jgi:hypothetical protein
LSAEVLLLGSGYRIKLRLARRQLVIDWVGLISPWSDAYPDLAWIFHQIWIWAGWSFSLQQFAFGVVD